MRDTEKATSPRSSLSSPKIMRKSVNFVARFIAVAIYFAIVAPVCMGGLAFAAQHIIGFFDNYGFYSNLWVMLAVVLLIIVPLAMGWSLLVAGSYIKLINRINLPFLNPAVNVYKTR